MGDIVLGIQDEPIGLGDNEVSIYPDANGNLCSKRGSNPIRQYSTGVTPEEVQDIIGNSIISGDEIIKTTYDDENNKIQIEIDESKISHVSLKDKDIDSHPQYHNDERGDTRYYKKNEVDVSISNSINNHVSQSTPHLQYETTSQLNSRDSLNRDRSNHTGTQLSSTISNFVSTVLSSILTGLGIGENSPILSSDSLLVALAKLQNQISWIKNNVSTPIFGSGFEEFIDDTPFTTNANTNQVAASFSTGIKVPGKYRIGWKWNYTCNSISNDSIFGLYVDGVRLDNELNIEGKDITNNITYTNLAYVNFNTNSTHQIEFRVRTESSLLCTVNTVRVEIWRVS